MNTQEIVGKLWNLCNVLRDDGITYHQYVTELTYILFLKMADETGTDEMRYFLIVEVFGWDEGRQYWKDIHTTIYKGTEDLGAA